MLKNDLELDLATLERVKEKLRFKYERINQSRVKNEKALFNREKQKSTKACAHTAEYTIAKLVSVKIEWWQVL